MQASRLGDLLVKNNLITKEQLAKALDEQKDSGGQLRLAGVTDRVGAIFKMAGVDELLVVDPTRHDSVSALES